jgi:O-antigen ligase
MRKILEASLVYRWLTAAAQWIDRQWNKSYLALVLSGAKEKRKGAYSIFSSLAALIHKWLCALFNALRLNKLFSGSIFARYFFWCAVAAFIAPIAPTMVTLALVLMAAVSMIITFGTDKNRRLTFSPMNKWVYFYALIYMITTLTSVTFKESLMGGLLTTAFILFAIILQNAITTRKQVDTLIYLLVAAGFVISVYGFLQVITGVESTKDWIDEDTFSAITLRVYSTLDNPNVLAEYLLLIIPIGVASIFTSKTGTGKTMSVIATGAMVLCMILTYSRGGWLGLVFSAAIFLVLLDRRFIVLGVLGLIALMFVLPDSILARFQSITDMSDSSTSYRIYIWMATINMLKDYWFCGIGTGISAYKAVYPKYSFNAVSAPHSHNLYLQIMCESGICGIVVFLGLLCSFFRQTASALSRNKDKNTRIQLIAVISGMAGFLLQAMTDYSFYNYRVTLMFWIIIALGVLLTRSWEDTKGNEE